MTPMNPNIPTTKPGDRWKAEEGDPIPNATMAIKLQRNPDTPGFEIVVGVQDPQTGKERRVASGQAANWREIGATMQGLLQRLSKSGTGEPAEAAPAELAEPQKDEGSST